MIYSILDKPSLQEDGLRFNQMFPLTVFQSHLAIFLNFVQETPANASAAMCASCGGKLRRVSFIIIKEKYICIFMLEIGKVQPTICNE